MINPDFELNRLRWSLHNKQWLPEEVDQIIDTATQEIDNIILDVISNASADAISYAETIGAEEFIADIDIVQEGSLYFVRTRSGKTDYSIPRIENLPNLLRNGKMSKDGSIYKVIPMRDKVAKNLTSSFQMQLQQQSQIDAARDTIVEANKNNRSIRANTMADQFRQNLAKTIGSRKKDDVRGPVSSFRTVSSKQDPKSDWVIPEKERDMTQYLLELNDRIKDSVEGAVITIINFYQQEYGQ